MTTATSGPVTTRTHAVLIALILLGAALRVTALTKPFYVDEVTTLTVASQPLASMAEVMRKIDASPALYPLLLHGWLKVSHGDIWVRLLSALFGVGVVAACYGLGRAAFGVRTGLWAAFVVAIAPIHVEYAQYVRSYSLFTLVAVLQLWAFFRCLVPDPPSRGYGETGSLEGRHSMWPLAALAVATAAMLYTHYLSLLVLAPEGLYALWRIRAAPRRVLQIGAAVAVAGLMFVPGIPLLRHNLTFDAVRNADRVAAPAPQKILPDLFGELALGRRDLGFQNATVRRATLTVGLVLFPLLIGVGVIAGWRRSRHATVLLLAFAVLPILLYVASGRSLVAVRFFLPFGIAMLVVAAHGLASMTQTRAVALGLALAVTCAVPLVHFVRDFSWSYDHRRVAETIALRWQPGDIILFVHPFESLHYQWYLGPEKPVMGLTFTPLVEQTSYVIKPKPLVVAEAESRALAAAGTHDRLWIVGQSPRSFTSRDAAQEQEFLAWMAGRFGQVDDLSPITHDDPVVRLYRGRAALAGR